MLKMSNLVYLHSVFSAQSEAAPEFNLMAKVDPTFNRTTLHCSWEDLQAPKIYILHTQEFKNDKKKPTNPVEPDKHCQKLPECP